MEAGPSGGPSRGGLTCRGGQYVCAFSAFAVTCSSTAVPAAGGDSRVYEVDGEAVQEGGEGGLEEGAPAVQAGAEQGTEEGAAATSG